MFLPPEESLNSGLQVTQGVSLEILGENQLKTWVKTSQPDRDISPNSAIGKKCTHSLTSGSSLPLLQDA